MHMQEPANTDAAAKLPSFQTVQQHSISVVMCNVGICFVTAFLLSPMEQAAVFLMQRQSPEENGCM